jgi:hypothetical protein
MFISVSRDGKLALREPDDFKRLHIEADRGMSIDEVSNALASIARREDNDFWLEVEALKALSGRAGDPAWEQNFATMIASVEKFGWLRPNRQRVRCHLKTK